jgi:tyrosyl-tRNA synthetase
LEGLDGVNKMSKSLGNYIGVTEKPDDMFGKLMSISDELMWRYFDLLSFRANAEIAQLRTEVAGGRNPMSAKFELAQEITTRFHGATAARSALDNFRSRSQKGEMPDEIPKKTEYIDSDAIAIGPLLKQSGMAGSSSEANRLIGQGGVRLNGEKLTDIKQQLQVGGVYVLQVGKRQFAEITLVRK